MAGFYCFPASKPKDKEESGGMEGNYEPRMLRNYGVKIDTKNTFNSEDL